jgi:hypothetical protein
MLYISRKRSVGGDGSNQHTEEQLGQSGPIASTAEAVAKETGVSPRTIKRDAAYAEADQLTQSGLREPRTPR